MPVPTRIVLAFVLLSATCVSAVGASPAGGTLSPEPVRKRTSPPSPSAILLQLQQTIRRLDVSDDPAAEDIRSLTRLLAIARGRTIRDAALATLATTLGSAVAQGSFDEESVERLAQNLYAAVNGRELTRREGGLVILDISGVLEKGRRRTARGRRRRQRPAGHLPVGGGFHRGPVRARHPARRPPPPKLQSLEVAPRASARRLRQICGPKRVLRASPHSS